MRDLDTLIGKLINLTPKDETNMIRKLEHIKKGTKYTAPEDMMDWKLVADLLTDEIPQPIEDWHFDILSEWTQMTRAELEKL